MALQDNKKIHVYLEQGVLEQPHNLSALALYFIGAANPNTHPSAGRRDGSASKVEKPTTVLSRLQRGQHHQGKPYHSSENLQCCKHLRSIHEGEVLRRS